VANSRSAKKRIRSNEVKHLRNKAVRSAVRTKVGQARRALLSSDSADPLQEVRAAVSALDRAAEKGILHRNNAARRKSRLAVLAARITRVGGEEQARVRAAAAGGEKGKSARPGPKAAARRTPAAPKATAKPASKTAAKPATKTAAKPATTPVAKATPKTETKAKPDAKPEKATPKGKKPAAS